MKMRVLYEVASAMALASLWVCVCVCLMANAKQALVPYVIYHLGGENALCASLPNYALWSLVVLSVGRGSLFTAADALCEAPFQAKSKSV